MNKHMFSMFFDWAADRTVHELPAARFHQSRVILLQGVEEHDEAFALEDLRDPAFPFSFSRIHGFDVLVFCGMLYMFFVMLDQR